MTPARTPKRIYEETRLLVINQNQSVQHANVGRLFDFLNAGDLLVVNRSGTLPSSFNGMILRNGLPIEIRLAAFRGRSPSDFQRWSAVSFGAGDWKMPTEARALAPTLAVGDNIRFSADLGAHVVAVDPRFSRLIQIEFESTNLIQRLFQHGRPIQYSYLEKEIEVWDQQTLFSGPPISVEPPSAAFPLNWQMILGLRKRGVSVATLLHGAGLSSTGDPDLEAEFPLPEYFEVPESTVDKIEETRARGGRIIALGTTVVRALESAYADKDSIKSRGHTTLKLDGKSVLRVTDSMITGMHEAGTSHLELMHAFCDSQTLVKVFQEADRLNYRSHEYGDLTMITA